MPIETDRKYMKNEIHVKQSPVFELANAFHVLVVPEHHGFLAQWVGNIKDMLTSEENDTLYILSKTYNQGIEIASCVFDLGEFDDCKKFINGFKHYDIIQFLYSFFEESVNREKINECIGNPESSFEILKEEVGDWVGIREITVYVNIIQKRFEIHANICSMLDKIYNSDFQKIIQNQVRYYSSSIESLSGKLTDKLPLDIAQEIMGKKFQRVSQYEKYYFIPSYFIYPHNIRIFNEKALILIYSYGHDVTAIEEKLARINTALLVISDKTRLKILRMLFSGKSYGKVIASRLNLTTATISHHLEILRDAGFIYEEKTENIKYFSCNKTRVEEVIRELQEYLYNMD